MRTPRLSRCYIQFSFFLILSRSSWLIGLLSLLQWVQNLRLLFFFPPLTTSFSSTTLHQSSVITMPIAPLLQPRQNLFLMLNLLNTPFVKSYSNSFLKKFQSKFAIWPILYCTDRLMQCNKIQQYLLSSLCAPCFSLQPLQLG